MRPYQDCYRVIQVNQIVQPIPAPPWAQCPQRQEYYQNYPLQA